MIYRSRPLAAVAQLGENVRKADTNFGYCVRKQYFFWPSERGLLAWDVDRLIELSRDLERRRVPLSEIRELDEPHWYSHEGDVPTCRSILEHVRLIQDVDRRVPIILNAEGRVMDGMHRVARASLEGLDSIQAVRFPRTPEPDFVGVDPKDLPYDDD
jgi:hypothetical protein